MRHANKEAELCILGSVVKNERYLDELDGLTSEDFYVAAHGKAFSAMGLLRENGGVTLIGLLENFKDDHDCTAGFLTGLMKYGSDLAGARAAARVVKKNAVIRNVITVCDEIRADADSRSMKSEELLDSAEAKIFALTQRGVKGALASHSEAVAEGLEVFEQRIASFRRGEVVGVPYGLHDLDKATGGMRPGELIVIGARPGVGKTILGAHLADVTASRGLKSMFVSLEQAKYELALRLLAKHSQVNAFKIRSGSVTDAERRLIYNAAEMVKHYPIFWDDAPNQTLGRISAQARRKKAKDGLDLLVVDYMQLIEATNRKLKRHEQVGEMSRGLKLLARNLNIPIVAMAQLNREAEKRGGEPNLSDLREAGSIEQDADTVILMHKEGYRTEGQTTSEVKLLIRKQRNGPLTNVMVIHDEAYYALVSAAEKTRRLA